ncbi:MAG: hypothetical protein OSJ59_02470 [Lachnospiraceae bacterium]|mgnify:FL=1|nr:hypothetical protein [Lachnospiraceae bacterium]
MKEYLWKHRAVLLTGIPALVIFLLATYRLSETGQPILFNDEIGYWSNSAFFLGMDWTSVTGNINYYSYGYSLLLILLRVMARMFFWSWDELYHAGIVLNGGFLVGSYLISLKLAERYLPEMDRIVRTAVCFVVCTYSSYIVYAHITWTECTLLFFFWVFLYVMMRVTDRPAVGNHVAFAVVSFYLYTVHQRSLGIVVTAVLVVLCMRLLRKNRLGHVAAFLGSLYLCGLLHSVVKWNLQHVNYLGEEPAALRELVGHAFTGTAKLFLAAGFLLLLILYLIEKRRYKILAALLAAGLLAAAVLCWQTGSGGGTGAADIAAAAAEPMADGADQTVDVRISVNDFSGQWGVLRNLFTVNGLIRLGISIVGKWFYLASATGFVICWGIAALCKNMWLLCRDVLRRVFGRGGTQENQAAAGDGETAGQVPVGERLWLFGVLVAWFSTFMISAIYKEGFYKNDDLFNGRYVEFTIGFLLIYGLNCLINDKKWVRKMLLVMVLYIAAGYLCQYAIDEVGRKEFELAHCVMFGRMVWNYEVPVGKVRVVEEYIIPYTLWFFVILKLMRERFPKAAVVRTVLALAVPLVVWSYLGRSIVDNYVVVRNEKQEAPLPPFASWISVLGRGNETVYYIMDSANQRNAGLLQYLLQDRTVVVTNLEQTSFEEDAFYVMKQDYIDTERVADRCELVMGSRGYLLLINKNGKLMEAWRPFMD